MAPTLPGRSQPPFSAKLLAPSDGSQGAGAHLPQFGRAYAFWMDRADRLAPGTAYRRVAEAGGEYPLQDVFGWTNGVLPRVAGALPRSSQPMRRAGRTQRGAT